MRSPILLIPYSLKRFCNFRNVSIHKDISLDYLTKHIVIVSLNRSSGKNSLSLSLIEELNNALSKIENDDKINVMILKSSVHKVFCAGADLKERLKMPQEEVSTFVRLLRNTFQRVALLPFVTIASIDGAAVGGGLELALSCDLRIGSTQSKFGLPETSLAIIPGAGGTQRLPKLVGIAKAKEMIFLGSIITAAEAKNINLINILVAENTNIDDETIEIAKKISEKGPIALRNAKKAIDSGIDKNITIGLEIEGMCYEGVVSTSDRIEGLIAFNEKRKPQYSGK